MIKKVSDKWLDDVIMLYELGGIGSDLDHAAFCELRTRRAVEREQAAPEPDAWPLGWTLVQDGGMVMVVNSKGVSVAAYAIQIESAPVIPRNVQCHSEIWPYVVASYAEPAPVEPDDEPPVNGFEFVGQETYPVGNEWIRVTVERRDK